MRIAYQDHGVTLCYILDYTDNIFQLLTIELTLTSTSYINMLFTPNTPQVSDYNVLKVLKKKNRTLQMANRWELCVLSKLCVLITKQDVAMFYGHLTRIFAEKRYCQETG